jgi:hemerythrin-like domain-containing protein
MPGRLLLTRDGHDLLRDLEAVTRAENMSQELVDARIRVYAERLRHNMALEELTLFPSALKSLDEKDWAEIDSVGLRREFDPLFDGEADGEFAGLYHVIMDEAVTTP